MGKTVLTIFSFLISTTATWAQQLPQIVRWDTLYCGVKEQYVYDAPNAAVTAAAFVLRPDQCMPLRLRVSQEAYSIPDSIAYAFRSNGQWQTQMGLPWHSGYKLGNWVNVPDGTDSIMLLNINNLGDYTRGWVMVECQYPPAGLCCTMGITLNAPEKVCPGDEFVVEASATKGSGQVSYVWANGDTGTTCVASIIQTGSVNVTATDAYGCTAVGSVVVSVPDAPIIFEPVTACLGDTLSLPDTMGIVWAIDDSFVVVQQNSVSVIGTIADAIGCDYEIPFTVAPSQRVPLTDTMVCAGEAVEFALSGASNSHWVASDGNNMTEALRFRPMESTSVIVSYSDQNDCPQGDTVYAFVAQCYNDSLLYVPNIFSLGVVEQEGNNLFRVFLSPRVLGEWSIESVSIHDRWGGLLYDSRSNEGWDGTARTTSQPVQAGVYIWVVVLRAPDGDGGFKRFTLRGDVTVVK